MRAQLGFFCAFRVDAPLDQSYRLVTEATGQRSASRHVPPRLLLTTAQSRRKVES